jgi:predicted transcriptional regulator
MTTPKISEKEWPVMDALWTGRIMSIGEIKDWIRREGQQRINYATVQTMVLRLEARGAVRRVSKIRTFYLFEAAITRENAELRLLTDLLGLLGGDVRPILEYCIETGRITMEDVRAAEGMLKDLARYKVLSTAGWLNRQGQMVADLPARPKPIPSYPAVADHQKTSFFERGSADATRRSLRRR